MAYDNRWNSYPEPHKIPLVIDESWEQTEERWFVSLPPGHAEWPIFIG
jgi:hypothetical protein